MDEIIEDVIAEWKRELRLELINGIIGDTQKKSLEKVGYYYMNYAPAFIYKYYDDDLQKLESIKNNKMWYSAPCKFNDVFDCDILIDEKEIFKSALEMFPDKRGIKQGSFKWLQLKQSVNKAIQTLRFNFENLKTTMGITCLSESYDSLLMWAHYANNHCGICVEYELNEINKQLQFSPVPVIYSDERARYCSLKQETIETDTIKVFFESLTSKSPEWSYEREWRIIRDDGACGTKWDREKKGALLDMIRPNSIILGCMVKPDFENAVHKYCKDKKINLYKMEKNRDLYRLEKVAVLSFD